jgi:hypothetical protein
MDGVKITAKHAEPGGARMADQFDAGAGPLGPQQTERRESDEEVAERAAT